MLTTYVKILTPFIPNYFVFFFKKNPFLHTEYQKICSLGKSIRIEKKRYLIELAAGLGSTHV